MTELKQAELPLTSSNIGKWKPYLTYKNSGIEWLREIPAYWKLGKLGSECIVKARLGWKGLKADEYVDAGYLFLSTPNIKGRDIDFEKVNYITAERYFESPEIMLREGDVLVAKDGSTLGITNVIRYLPAPTTVNSSIAVLRPIKGVDSVFLYWFLSSSYIQEFIQSMKDGMGVPHLFQADLRKFAILIPSSAEQQSIASYLDRETTKINTLIAKKERLIKLLREKRAALISHAVTKGLDPDVKMKDSGVEWLGEISEHWEVRRLKFVVKSMVAGPFGSSLTKDLYTTEGFRVYGQEQVIPADFSIGDYYISEKMYFSMQRYAVNVGDVLVSCVGTFGKVAVVPTDAEPGIINPRLVKLVPKRDEIIPVYLGILLKSQIAFEQMKESSHGGTMDIINIGLLSEILLPLPTLQEQIIIMDYLENETARIDALISKIVEAIEKLREYSAALISAAVTGKIDVRDEAAITDEVNL